MTLADDPRPSPSIPTKITIEQAKSRVDYGIITIKPEEFSAVLKRLPPRFEALGQTQYNISQIEDALGNTCCAAVVKSWDQGDLPLQSIANALITDLQPRAIIIVGIAGARPAIEFTLGDVILANRMFDFNVTASNPDGTTEYAPRSQSAHRCVQVISSNLVADAVKYGEWNSEESIGMRRPHVTLAESNFIGPPEWQQKTREALNCYFGENGSSRNPIVCDGPIGSSSTLMKDPVEFSEWLDRT
jgi:hypothetical protein